jgi:hypothetical protein
MDKANLSRDESDEQYNIYIYFIYINLYTFQNSFRIRTRD